MKLNRLQEEVLIEGLDDWVGLWEFVHILNETTPHDPPDERKRAALRYIEDLLTTNYMRVGSLSSRTFVAWDLSVGDALRKIEDEWRALKRDPTIGDICWFANTETGNRVARDILNARKTA